MNTSNTSTICAAAFVVVGAFTISMLSATARAADANVLTQKVSYADLNIQTPEGAKVLYKRIRHAAFVVCPGFGDLQDEFKCVDQAIAGAIKQVDSPALSALRSPSVLRLASK